MEITLWTVEEEVGDYLAAVMLPGGKGLASASSNGHSELPDAVFGLLTDRQFCHLSRGAAGRYRERTLTLLDESLNENIAVPFWYDIGPGYHASLHPGESGPSFDVGLSELLILHQVRSFLGRLSGIYPPGGRFWLVVDNLCGLRTNDIPVDLTEAYCARFRELIREQGLVDRVELLVESEAFDLAEYDRLLADVPEERREAAVTEDDLENVERFLGRRCTVQEANERIDRYRRTGIVTELLLARVVGGVRMTQRASATTLGFRPFPGGDSRTQCGHVAMGRNTHGKLRPILLTSRNVGAYELRSLTFPGLLPSLVNDVTYAERV